MNCKNISIEDLDVRDKPDSYEVGINGNKTDNIRIISVNKLGADNAVIGDEVDKSTVEIL